MAFTQKLIDVQLNLANGQFQGGGNTVTVSGLRVSFTGTFVGGQEQGTAEISIYGLPLQLMNQMSTVGTQLNLQNKNNVAVLAGDAETGMSVVFEGTIFSAFVDAQAMPDVAFRIYAKPGLYHAVVPATPISVRGSAKRGRSDERHRRKDGTEFRECWCNCQACQSILRRDTLDTSAKDCPT